MIDLGRFLEGKGLYFGSVAEYRISRHRWFGNGLWRKRAQQQTWSDYKKGKGRRFTEKRHYGISR